MARHLPCIVWMLRRSDTPLRQGHVTTDQDASLWLWLEESDDDPERHIHLDRDTARLVARRLNQCLETTR